MSQKKTKKQRKAEERALRDKEREQLQEERDSIYTKPILARLYDKMNPGDYTIRQDFHHSLFLFAFIVIIVVCIGAIWIGNDLKSEHEHESTLTIPATSFISGQESTIVDMLDGYGFIDTYLDENGNIVTFGTAEMVQAYKDSYKEKNVDSIISSFSDDRADLGVESISLSDDAKTLTIKTYRDLSASAEDMSALMTTDEMNKMISVLSNWCGLRNGGAALTTMFVNVFDTTDGTGGTQYWSSTRPNGDQMVADLEKQIAEAANGDDSDTNDEENTDSGDSGNMNTSTEESANDGQQ